MPIDDILLEAEAHMEKAIEHLQHELRGIRTGRASPGLIEHVKVDYYGTPTDLRNIANISVPESNQLLVRPFAPQDVGAILKAINDSKLGLNPQTEELMNQPMGSLPSTIETGAVFSPRSIFFMSIFQPVWPSSGFTPSTRGPLISQR